MRRALRQHLARLNERREIRVIARDDHDQDNGHEQAVEAHRRRHAIGLFQQPDKQGRRRHAEQAHGSSAQMGKAQRAGEH